MRWLSDRHWEAGNVPDADSIEHIGHLARTVGLDRDDFDLLALYVNASPDEITRGYKADNAAWATAQAVIDGTGLAGLDAHLTMKTRGHHVPD